MHFSSVHRSILILHMSSQKTFSQDKCILYKPSMFKRLIRFYKYMNNCFRFFIAKRISFNKNAAFWSLCWLSSDVQEAFIPPCSECSVCISLRGARQISSNDTKYRPERWPFEHQSCFQRRYLQLPECELVFILLFAFG